MQGLVEEYTKLRSKVAENWEAAAEDETNITVMDCFHKKVSVVVKAVSELLPAVETFRDLRVDAEKRLRSADMKLLLVKY